LREEIVSSVSGDTGQGRFSSLCTAKGIGAYKVHATVSHGTSSTRGWQETYISSELLCYNKISVGTGIPKPWTTTCRRP
jgi:hypothetical protein